MRPTPKSSINNKISKVDSKSSDYYCQTTLFCIFKLPQAVYSKHTWCPIFTPPGIPLKVAPISPWKREWQFKENVLQFAGIGEKWFGVRESALIVKWCPVDKAQHVSRMTLRDILVFPWSQVGRSFKENRGHKIYQRGRNVSKKRCQHLASNNLGLLT